jgi:hypothetical protein
MMRHTYKYNTVIIQVTPQDITDITPYLEYTRKAFNLSGVELREAGPICQMTDEIMRGTCTRPIRRISNPAGQPVILQGTMSNRMFLCMKRAFAQSVTLASGKLNLPAMYTQIDRLYPLRHHISEGLVKTIDLFDTIRYVLSETSEHGHITNQLPTPYGFPIDEQWRALNPQFFFVPKDLRPLYVSVRRNLDRIIMTKNISLASAERILNLCLPPQ